MSILPAHGNARDANPTGGIDRLVFGQRLRHHRRRADLTLAQLGEAIGRPAPYLSQLENGHTEPRLTLIGELAAAVGVSTADLLDPSPPTRRAELEIRFLRAQQDPAYQALGLPRMKPSLRLPDEALEHLVGLYDAVAGDSQRSQERQRAGDVARQANVALRESMRASGNYFEDIERVAAEVLESVDYAGTGPVSERTLIDLCNHFGFTVARVQDLPRSARSITDQRERIIYIPQRNDLPTRAARSVVLQTLGHYALSHADTDDLTDYLRQRVESNYFAAAILAPETPAVDFLRRARNDDDISVEDLKEVFYISYEMAAHRLTNLATRHLGITLHFLRVDEEGVVWKAYENDGVPLPTDVDGAIEGQKLCREWGTRQAFNSEDSFSLHEQYTDTPSGRYWCTTYVEADRSPYHAVTVGTTAEQARWFRGSETRRQSTSSCPEPTCCRRPASEVRQRWEGAAWPSARDRSHVLSGLPVEHRSFSRFPGVDMMEVYDFLESR